MLSPIKEAQEGWTGKDYISVGGLILVAITLRIAQLLSIYVINPDAIDYIGSAKAIGQGRLAEGFGISHVSVYPVLIALLQPFIGEWISTARGITAFFGIITVVPLYLVSARLLDWPWRLIPPLFYCLSPSLTHYSMDVIREPLSWFAVFMALWAIVEAVAVGRRLWFVVAGIFFLFAIANRIDGIISLGVASAWIVWRGLRKGLLGRAFEELALLCMPLLLVGTILIFLFFGTPFEKEISDLFTYKRQISTALGASQESHHQAVEGLLENIPQAYLRNLFFSAWEHRYGLAALELADHWVRAAHPALLAVSLVGVLMVAKWKMEDLWWLLLFVLGAYMAVGYVRVSGAFAISRRHLGIAVISGYCFAGLGMAWLYEKLGRFKGRFPRKSPYLVLALLVASTIPWTLRPQRADKGVRRVAGEWIRAQGITEPIVATQHQIVAFYAEGRWVPLKELLTGSDCSADFLVVGEKEERQALSALNNCKAEGYLVQEMIFGNAPKLMIYRVRSFEGPR